MSGRRMMNPAPERPELKRLLAENKLATTTDAVNHPRHYQATNGIEVIDVVEGFELNHRLANVVEYVLRADRKGAALQDLKKAQFYLDREIMKRSSVDGDAKS